MKNRQDIEETVVGLKSDMESLTSEYLVQNMDDNDYETCVIELRAKIEALEWVLEG